MRRRSAIVLCSVPLDCFTQCHAGRCLGKSKFAYRPSWIKELVSTRKPHLIRRGHGYALAAQPSHSYVDIGPALRNPVGNAQAHLGPSGNLGQQVENLLEGQVFSAQDVSSSDPSSLCGQEVTCRYVLDIHDVQAGIYITENTPLQEVHNDLSKWRGLVITNHHRCARINDDHRQALAREVARNPL